MLGPQYNDNDKAEDNKTAANLDDKLNTGISSASMSQAPPINNPTVPLSPTSQAPTNTPIAINTPTDSTNNAPTINNTTDPNIAKATDDLKKTRFKITSNQSKSKMIALKMKVNSITVEIDNRLTKMLDK